MTNTEFIAAVYILGGSIFLGGFLLAVVTTGARFLWYVRYRHPRPRLLNRDIIVKGGMFTSFGLIAAIRFVPPEQRVTLTQGNVAWAVATTLPAVVAIVVYCIYELFVIPRDRAEPAVEFALESSVQEAIALTREGIGHAQAAYSEANHANMKLTRLTEIVGGKEDKA